MMSDRANMSNLRGANHPMSEPEFFLYDYINIYSDEHYAGRIKTVDIERFFLDVLEFEKTSSLSFSKVVCGKEVRATGYLANAQGGYAFYTLDGIEEINLIEIDIPLQMNMKLEKFILATAYQIAKQYSWIVDERREY